MQDDIRNAICGCTQILGMKYVDANIQTDIIHAIYGCRQKLDRLYVDAENINIKGFGQSI